MNSRFLRNGIVTLVLVVGTAALLYMFLFPNSTTATVPYSGSDQTSFQSRVAAGDVQSVVQKGGRLEITLRELGENGKGVVVATMVPNQFVNNVLTDMVAWCKAPACAEPPSLVGE